MIGQTLSHFRITAKLGEGGMGEVYRADDTKLDRQVAIKVLPEAVAADPERLARFEREAKVLASLNHPNIAAIYSFESAEREATSSESEPESRPGSPRGLSSLPLPEPPGALPDDSRTPGPRAVAPTIHFLVMELVEGQDLDTRLKRGAIPLDEALPIALQIAEALEAAHDQGIIHRDLKPANVKVTDEGLVKVLDFGLAKALAPEPISGNGLGQGLSMSPTLTQAMTGANVLLGTAGYMSPEQARGRPVDRRGDIWAFGCVLFEMLTGHRTFDGDTVTDILGAIVHKEPDLAALPAAVPQRIRRLLELCLEKDASRRLQAIGDARIAIQEWLENPVESLPASQVGPSRLPWWIWGLLVAAGLLGLVGGRLLRPEPPPEPVRRFPVDLAEAPLYDARGAATIISPDGLDLVFVTEDEDTFSLLLRPLDRLETTLLAQSSQPLGIHQPFFSPDGKWLAYMSQTELKKMPITGGSPIRLAEVDGPRGGSWGPDGTLVFAPRSRGGLSLVPAAGGEVRTLTDTESEQGFVSHRWPQWLPGGKAVLYSVVSGQGSRLEVVEIDSGQRREIHPQAAYGRYVPTGHILFVDNSALFALPFDAERLEVEGSPMPVLEGVESQQDDGEAQFDVSDTGTLVYMPGSDDLQGFETAWADRSGQLQPLWNQTGFYGTPRLSPDGKRLAASVLRGDDWDVWVYDIERQVATRLTFGPGYDADPVWSPDGRWIAFASDREGEMAMYRKRSDGTGEAEVLIEPGRAAFPAPLSWSPDGRRIVLSTPPEGQTTGSDIWFLSVDDGEIEPYLTTPFAERDACFSPDGRWLAYTSNESGILEVYVRSLDGSGRWQITDGGGAQPLWSPAGDELFYRSTEGLMAVEVDIDGEEFRAGRPQRLFGEIFGSPVGVTVPGYVFFDYDVSRDGQRFVVFPRAGTDESPGARVHIVTGWFEELESLTESAGDRGRENR